MKQGLSYTGSSKSWATHIQIFTDDCNSVQFDWTGLVLQCQLFPDFLYKRHHFDSQNKISL
jgi:hypothetical protein